MLGWEFPPYKSGGLGTACYGLTKALSKKGIEIIFVIPKAPFEIKSEHVNLILADRYITPNIREIKVASNLTPYLNFDQYLKLGSTSQVGPGFEQNYGRNLMEEVARYTELARAIATRFKFDVIHAHDWMCAKAGLAAKEVSGKPLVVQIHATEFDRTAGFPNQIIYDIEKEAMSRADKVVTVSNFTKGMIVRHYGIADEKVEVVYNAVNFGEGKELDQPPAPGNLKWTDKVVLFLGRITIQKGPGYFLEAAKKVLEIDPTVKFVIAGAGDLMPSMVEKAAQLGISKSVIFSGFLRGKEVDAAFKMADLYVMPSVSEPFGISPLEAMKNGTPVIISKQSGVSEVVKNCLKVDFWDVDEMVNMIIGVLNYKKVGEEMSKLAFKEVMGITWNDSAKNLIKVYKRLIS